MTFQVSPSEFPIDQPALMRLLASPVRIAIYNFLRDKDGATATTCGQAVDLSPSAASYHLRLMAKHGLIEQVARGNDGRETWWTPTTRGFRLATTVDDEGGELIEGLRTSLLTDALERVRDYFMRQQEVSHDWQLEAGMSYYVAHVTVEELRELRACLEAEITKYTERSSDHRPSGSQPVTIIAGATPLMSPIRDT